MGRPRSISLYSLGPWHVSGEQHFCIDRLFYDILEMVRLRSDVPGRGKGMFNILDMLSKLECGCDKMNLHDDTRQHGFAGAISPQPVTVDQILNTVPLQAGLVHPEEHLLEDRASVFLDSKSRVSDPPPLPCDVPVGCYMVDPQDEANLRRFLLERGMAKLLRSADVAKMADGQPITGGLFGVPHRKGLRLIFDDRPANAHQDRLGWAKETLPNGIMFSRMILHPGEGIRGTLDDISSYFYRCRNAESELSMSAFGNSFLGNDFSDFGGVHGEMYYLALCVVGMGDLNAVDITQAMHCDILSTVGCMAEETRLVYRNGFPKSKLLEGIYIDDHLLAWISDLKSLARPYGPDYDLWLKSREAYHQAHLEISFDKGVGFASQEKDAIGSQDFIAWGTHIRSRSGKVGAPMEKRLNLSLLFMHIISFTYVPKLILQRLLGLFIHPICHQRPLMCCLETIYSYIARFEDHCFIPLTLKIKEELCLAGLLMSVAHASTRNQVSTVVTATDATPTRGGGCRIVHFLRCYTERPRTRFGM